MTRLVTPDGGTGTTLGVPRPLEIADSCGFVSRGPVERRLCDSATGPLRPLRKSASTAFVVESGPLDTPCWVWQGCINSKGYAVRGTASGGRYLVHRRVFEISVRALREDEQIHHRCGRRACVNPAHLEAHTQLAHSREHYGNQTLCERVVDALMLLEAARPAEIADLVGARRGSVAVALTRAVERGDVVRVAPALYALPAAEVAA